jgi:hypothetical protein
MIHVLMPAQRARNWYFWPAVGHVEVAVTVIEVLAFEGDAGATVAARAEQAAVWMV